MYRTLSQHYREKFGCKVYKLAIDGGFTCPNRDGTIGYGGCAFCAGDGSGAFAQQHEGAYQWEKNFTAAESSKWVIVNNKTLTVSDRKSLPNGNKVIFFGNSRTFYGKCVLEKGQTVETQAERVGDEGYFYQICKANGYDVDVTNFTFGGHVLKDFYSETCITRSSHHHLKELVDRNYDYVVMQTGSVDKDLGTIVETVQSMMDVFLAENPNTKFIFLVTNNVHYGNYAWRNTIKDLEQIGVTVVDWGALVNDLVNGLLFDLLALGFQGIDKLPQVRPVRFCFTDLIIRINDVLIAADLFGNLSFDFVKIEFNDFRESCFFNDQFHVVFLLFLID